MTGANQLDGTGPVSRWTSSASWSARRAAPIPTRATNCCARTARWWPVRPGLTVVVGYAECDAALRDGRLRVQDGAELRRHLSRLARASGAARLHRLDAVPQPARPRPDARLVSGGFTPRRISGLRPAIEQLTERLLDRLAAAGAGGAPVEFIAEFASRLPIAVISALLGVPDTRPGVVSPDRRRRDDRAWRGSPTPDALAVADVAMTELGEYFVALIERRRPEPADDVVSALVHGGEQLSRAGAGGAT